MVSHHALESRTVCRQAEIKHYDVELERLQQVEEARKYLRHFSYCTLVFFTVHRYRKREVKLMYEDRLTWLEYELAIGIIQIELYYHSDYNV